jgi:hypothetical protein
MKLTSGVGLLVVLAIGSGCSKKADGSSSGDTAGPAGATGSTVAAELPAEDRGYTDPKQGWGWSDRCWKSLQAGKLAAAKAECNEGLKVAAATGGPKPSLLYNLGLIEEKSGNSAGAKSFFEQSLALRPNAEVSAALVRVGGTPPATAKAGAVKKSIKCGSNTCDKICCGFSNKCAQDGNSCDRATNGEGSIYECDGAEDCSPGEICCVATTGRTTVSYCSSTATCKQQQGKTVCHADSDCSHGKCTGDGDNIKDCE